MNLREIKMKKPKPAQFLERKMNAKTLPTMISDAVKEASPALASALHPTLLVFLLFFPLSFMKQFLHEGGHALVNLVHGVPIHFLYAHPFSFVGFVRPMVDFNNIWQHASGAVVGILVPLLIFILFWKRRSFYTLPFLMIFPWTAIFHGIGGVLDMLGHTGDYNNLMQITGWPAATFYSFNIILAVVGIFFFLLLLPLLGLAPEDRKSLFVLPAGMLLYSALGSLVADLFVPGSPIDVRYHLAHEILVSAYYRPFFMASIGVLLAVLFITIYRRVYERLPAGLRTVKLSRSWRDLWYPGLLFTISMILGFMVIL